MTKKHQRDLFGNQVDNTNAKLIENSIKYNLTIKNQFNGDHVYIKKMIKDIGLNPKAIRELIEHKKKELKLLLSEKQAIIEIAYDLGLIKPE